MNPLTNTFNIFANGHDASIDACHATLLLGVLLSAKPQNLLEIGIGPGLATRTMLSAIEYNRIGKLTCLIIFTT